MKTNARLLKHTGSLPTAATATLGVLGFVALMAIAANVAIPLPGTPVPITLQTVVVVLAGTTLGPTLGAASMALYLLIGSVGLEVFAMSTYGLETIYSATGGFLIGFLLAQPILGLMTRRATDGSAPTRARILGAMLLAHVVIFGAGATWFHVATKSASVSATLSDAVWPFLPMMVVKIAIAMMIAKAALRARPWFDRAA